MGHIVCPHCAAVNNVPSGRDPLAAKCGQCSNPLFTGKPVDVGVDAFNKHLAHDEVPIVVDFWAAWCGPCRMMAPIFAQAASQLEPLARFLKVDTESESELASRLGIRSIPTLIVFRDGREQQRQAGVLDLSSLVSWIERAAGMARRH